MPCEIEPNSNRNWSADCLSVFWAHLHLQDRGATGQKMETKNGEIAAALFAVCNLQRGCPNSQSMKVNSEGVNLTFGSASRLQVICSRN